MNINTPTRWRYFSINISDIELQRVIATKEWKSSPLYSKVYWNEKDQFKIELNFDDFKTIQTPILSYPWKKEGLVHDFIYNTHHINLFHSKTVSIRVKKPKFIFKDQEVGCADIDLYNLCTGPELIEIPIVHPTLKLTVARFKCRIKIVEQCKDLEFILKNIDITNIYYRLLPFIHEERNHDEKLKRKKVLSPSVSFVPRTNVNGIPLGRPALPMSQNNNDNTTIQNSSTKNTSINVSFGYIDSKGNVQWASQHFRIFEKSLDKNTGRATISEMRIQMEKTLNATDMLHGGLHLVFWNGTNNQDHVQYAHITIPILSYYTINQSQLEIVQRVLWNESILMKCNQLERDDTMDSITARLVFQHGPMMCQMYQGNRNLINIHGLYFRGFPQPVQNDTLKVDVQVFDEQDFIRKHILCLDSLANFGFHKIPRWYLNRQPYQINDIQLQFDNSIHTSDNISSLPLTHHHRRTTTWLSSHKEEGNFNNNDLLDINEEIEKVAINNKASISEVDLQTILPSSHLNDFEFNRKQVLEQIVLLLTSSTNSTYSCKQQLHQKMIEYYRYCTYS